MSATPHHTTPYYSSFTIKWATLDREIDDAMALRERVFSTEQGLFQGSDRDQFDDCAQVLVALTSVGGWHDTVVGTVRIHHDGDNVWRGSRLAIDPIFRGQGGIGASLIRLAVGSANALGCTQFLAQVQKSNERLFRRLNWQSHYELILHNMLHVVMEADLSCFPPVYQPSSGFVIKNPRPVPVLSHYSPLLDRLQIIGAELTAQPGRPDQTIAEVSAQ